MPPKPTKEYEIGDIIQNNRVNIIIIGKEIRFIKEKYGYKGKSYKDTPRLFYQCHCNKCNNDYWKRKADVYDHGCPICAKSSYMVVKGYNDFATHFPTLTKYFVNINDAYTHSPMSNQRVLLKCPTCGLEKSMPLSDFATHGLACSGCSDGISYPEKFFVSIFRQLNVEFTYQLSKMHFAWCDKYRYDFYLPKLNLIVEVNGKQHYDDSNIGVWKKQKDEDKHKKELAKQNGFNYIEINASLSDMNFIKQSALNSELDEMLSLDNVDWEKCNTDASSSYVKQACDLWNRGLTTGEIANQMSVSIVSVKNYLLKGAMSNLCDYTTHKGTRRSLDERRYKRSRGVVVYQNGVIVGRFDSIMDLDRQSINLFGIHFFHPRISEAILGTRPNKYAKYGYMFAGFNKTNILKDELLSKINTEI